MTTEGRPNAESLKLMLQNEAAAIRALDREDELPALPSTDAEEIDLEYDEHSNVFSLAELPVSQWSSLNVSPKSKFGDSIWDFTSYPHVASKGAKINFDYISSLGINITDKKYAHWLQIAKALCFYSIPHFCTHSYVRSYSHLATQKTKVLRIVKLFSEERLYLGDSSSEDFRTINDLSHSTIEDFVGKLESAGTQWEFAWILQVWQRLSSQNLLPTIYRVFTTYITKEQVGEYRKRYDELCVPWSPIPLDDYTSIIRHCSHIVEHYSKDIIWLYETFYPTVVGAEPDKIALWPHGHSTGSLAGIEAFRAYKPEALDDGEPWWALRVHERIHPNDSGEYIKYAEVISTIASLIDACCTLIFATTGARRSEVMNLRDDCLSEGREGHWLSFKVFKTSTASQGDHVRIPIPDITAAAIKVLLRIGAESRLYGNHNYLFSTVSRAHFGNRTNLAHPERAVSRVAQACGVESWIHPHRFRKSLAMYMIHLDPRNLELIKDLFSHKSLKMTLNYILALPGIHDEVKASLIDQNVDILAEVIEGALKGRIGGAGGSRVRESVENSPTLQARLHDRGKETISQYVSSILDQGIKVFHRTNMAICLKTPGLTVRSPCDGINEDSAARLHPNLFACDPLNCRFAVFVESHVPSLKAEAVFHQRILEHPYCGEEQRTYSRQRISDALRRLFEVIGPEADSFIKKVRHG